MSITLYFAPQSSASRVVWSLAELGIPHDKVQLDLRAGDQKKPEHLARNPNGKVPTVVIDGTPVFESVAIQIALGERYGVDKGLWPRPGTPEHLEALSWIVWGQVTAASAMMRYMFSTSEWVDKAAHNPKQAELAMADVRTALRILDERLIGREYVVGTSFTLVDLDLAATLGWGLHVLKIDAAAEYPQLGAWLSRAMKRPSAASMQ